MGAAASLVVGLGRRRRSVLRLSGGRSDARSGHVKILGVIWELCSTAVVMVDGEVLACASEERFTRCKNDEIYPKRAIEYVLRQSGVAPEELDVVAMAGERFDPKAILVHKYSGFSALDRLREEREYWYPRLYLKKNVEYLDVFKDKLDLDQYPGRWDDIIAFLRTPMGDDAETNAFFQAFRRDVVSRHLDVDPAKIVFPHHHRSHALYAYYGSPVVKEGRVLVLTADAWGDDMNASVNVAEDGDIRRVSHACNFGLARLYRSMTLLLGMKPDEHEYKVMGLAPYARPSHTEGPLRVFRDTMHVNGIGFGYGVTPPDMYIYFKDRLEGHRFDSIAGGLQRYAEEILVQWTRNCLEATGARRLCFGGGIAMNVKALMEVAKLDGLDDVFVCPSPSDESLAIGAAYVVTHDACWARGIDPRTVLRPLANAYLGPDLEAGEVARASASIDRARHAVQPAAMAGDVARLLADGAIVGRCVGRSEFGARALGNRSILADPRQLDAVRLINEKVKSRDFWMPFAPSILEESAGRYLVNPKGLRAPYMTVAFPTQPVARREIPAALHQADFTCRPQVVTEKANPDYHALIGAFERLTGVGALLNTSFNIHGEPIVQTAADAVDVLERSGLDALLLGDTLIVKRR
jgi:carbamoyltransferase